MNAVIVVQTLLTRWEKSGRAHPVASVRNRLPSALELPAAILVGPVAYHSVTFDQRSNFAPRTTHDETRASPPQHDCGLSIAIERRPRNLPLAVFNHHRARRGSILSRNAHMQRRLGAAVQVVRLR